MSVRKDRNTRLWLLDISTINPTSGKRKRIVRKNFSTKKEAVDEEQRLRVIFLNERMPLEIYNIKLCFDLMLLEDKKDKKKSYLSTQEYNFNAHIADYFRYAVLSKLDYSSILIFREKLIEKGLSNNTVNKIMILLKKILDIALRCSVLKENPCCFLKKLPTDIEKMKFWTLEEFLVFDRSIKRDELIFKLFFRLAFYTGLRKGEILALQWKDIDFKKATIDVNKTVVKVHGEESLDLPKTKAGVRKVAIHKNLLTFLLGYQILQQEKFASYLKKNRLENLRIFEIAPATALDSGKLRKKFVQLLKRTPELTPIRIHDFRHSHAAMLIDLGVDPYVIKERLGHASIKTTYDIYGHLYPNKQKTVAGKINQLRT